MSTAPEEDESVAEGVGDFLAMAGLLWVGVVVLVFWLKFYVGFNTNFGGAATYSRHQFSVDDDGEIERMANSRQHKAFLDYEEHHPHYSCTSSNINNTLISILAHHLTLHKIKTPTNTTG